jgi:phage terminase small subunit
MAGDLAANPLRKAKHEAVLQAYFADATRVGYRAYLSVYPQSSEPAAKTAFSRLLKKADFAARLEFLEAGAAGVAVERSGIEIAAVVGELAKIGFASAKHYLRVLPGGEPAVDLSGLDDEQFAALAEVTVEDYVDGRGEDARDVRKVRFKLHNKQAALVSILEHLGGFPARKHELAGPGGGPIPIEDQTDVSPTEFARRIAFALEKGMRAPAPKPSTIAKPKGK